MNVETYTDVAPAAREWDVLADRAGASPFLRPGWIEAWWRSFGAGQLEIVALRRDGELVALVPLARNSGGLGSPTNWHTPEFGLIAIDDEARLALAETLFSARRRRVAFGFLNGDERDLDDLAAAARRSGYRVTTTTLERSPYVPVAGSWDQYLKGVDRHALKEMTRRRRRLDELAPLSFEFLDGREGLDQLLEDGFAVEGSGWKDEQGTAIVSRPETREFYSAVARWAAERGWLRLAFLRSGGRAIAFQFTIASNGVVYFLKGGYDSSFRRYAPGKLLAHDVLAQVFADRFERYEFLGNDEGFKREWTDQVRERVRLQAFAGSPAGLADWAASTYGRPLAKRVLRLARR